MHRSRRSTALVLALALIAAALAAPASAIYFGDDRAASHESGTGGWLDQLWESLVALFAAENGGIVPRP